jgi:hypothetical protein
MLMYNSRGKTVLEEAGCFTPGIGGVQQLDQMEKDTNHKGHTEQWLC